MVNTRTRRGTTQYAMPVNDQQYEDVSTDDDSEVPEAYVRSTHQQRELMRPWLIKEIDSAKVPGLAWQNKEKTIVKIPWTHGSRHGFDTAKDSCLFKRWAVHTGKCTKKEPKKWKANFRCAMNSLQDVKEIKNLSKPRGHNAYKMYQFLPMSARKTTVRAAGKQKKRGDEDAEDTPCKAAHQNTDHADVIRRVKLKVQMKGKARTYSDVSSVTQTSEVMQYAQSEDSGEESEGSELDQSLGSQQSYYETYSPEYAAFYSKHGAPTAEHSMYYSYEQPVCTGEAWGPPPPAHQPVKNQEHSYASVPTTREIPSLVAEMEEEQPIPAPNTLFSDICSFLQQTVVNTHGSNALVYGQVDEHSSSSTDDESGYSSPSISQMGEPAMFDPATEGANYSQMINEEAEATIDPSSVFYNYPSNDTTSSYVEKSQEKVTVVHQNTAYTSFTAQHRDRTEDVPFEHI